MFPNVNLADLCSDAVYQFTERKPLYLELLKYFSDLYDYRQAVERWNNQLGPIQRSERLWWVSCPPVRNTSPSNFNPAFNGIDRLPRR